MDLVNCSVPVPMFTPGTGVQLPPPVFKSMFDGLEKPLVIKNQLQPWFKSGSWDAIDVCRTLGSRGETSTFKVCPKRGTEAYRKHFGSDCENKVVFETHCEYVEAKFTDFIEWLIRNSSDIQSTVEEPSLKKIKLANVEEGEVELDQRCSQATELSNPLSKFSRQDYWVYADYKYMCHICKDYPEMLTAIDWSLFGFKGRDGKDSTLWIGTEEAYTPCHYDTYGCNIVAQLSGRKRWTLFSPMCHDALYPTRVPYEESSVFSTVNVTHPDLVKFPKFATATPYMTVLEPGDLLFVPRHWWHYVESVGTQTTVSVNMWIEQSTFPHERVKEAVVRTLVSQFSNEQLCDDSQSGPGLVNPNEVIFPTDENLRLLSEMIHKRKRQLGTSQSPNTENQNENESDLSEQTKDCSDSELLCEHETLSVQDFVKVITSDKVIGVIAETLLE